MKADVEFRPMRKGAVAGQPLGHQVSCLDVFEVGGVSHRALVEGMMRGTVLNRDGAALVAGLGETTRRQVALTIVSVDVLHTKGSRGLHSNPFELDFDRDWSEQWLLPNFAIRHLSLGDWFDVANLLDPKLLDQYNVRGFVDVWCGTPELIHYRSNDEDFPRIPPKTTLFKLVSKGGRVIVERHDQDMPVHVRGFVAFASCEVANS